MDHLFGMTGWKQEIFTNKGKSEKSELVLEIDEISIAENNVNIHRTL